MSPVIYASTAAAGGEPMTTRLEDLKPDALVKGLVGKEAVRLISVQRMGDMACQVFYRGQDGNTGDTILFRSSEADLELVSGGRKWTFEGDGDLFRLVSEAERIRLAYLFDPYVAVSSSAIDPLPHQISAVYEHMLPRQPMRFLLADDPGAGKTIMAGLLIKELLIRGELERCLIVAPGSLTEQWQDELKEKFELQFELLARDLINATGLGNPFAERPLLIVRMDQLSRDQELQIRLEQAPEWDLVVFDESHRMSAHYFGSEVKRTKRYDMGKRVGNHARNLLLMTATPHNGKDENFQLFMALLDEDRFAGQQKDAVHRSDPTDMMRRLVKEDKIRDRLGRPEAVVEIHGGVPRDRRRQIVHAFMNDPQVVVVLLANDAAGEGVNLQRAHLMVNYDLPWNPNRLEQRFGRIHRIGQKEVCHLWNLLAKDTRERDVYIQLLHKLEIARAALGDKVFDVLGQLFSGRSLRDLLMDAVRYNQQPERQLQMELEIEGAVNQEHLKRLLNQRALVQQGMDVHKVELLRQQMERAMARRIHPHYVHDFFIEAFRRLGGKVFEREKGRYEITYVPPPLLDRNQQIGFGVPVQPRYERICFEKEQVGESPRAELVSPGHPLLEACLSLVLERDGAVLAQGAVLVDERDLGTEPRMLFCLEHGLQDGRRNRHGKQQLISNRLQFLEINRQGEVAIAGSAPYLDYRPLKDGERQQIAGLLSESWLAQDWDQLVVTQALNSLVPEHLEEVKGERLERIAKASQEIQSRMQREINHWFRRHQELKLQETAGKQVRLPAQVAKERYELLVARLEKRKAQLALEAQISAKVPILKGGTLVIPVGLLLEAGGGAEEAGPDAAARKRVELLAMNAVFEAEKAMGRMPRDVSAQRGIGYDIESMDDQGDLFFIEVKGRVDGADSVTLTINEVNTGRNSPHRFRLALVTVTGNQAAAPVYVSGVDWGVPGFGDTQITKNLQQLLAAGRTPH